ncbi:conserved hypothetical protein [Oleispira antarctica RB-8]|uniref:Uncharacterized protein n=1 Tax=Oleispira antarctica RB-8 TaxID=698738 RepID=R4YN74_OLEAN|nr:conserved hypothetical protein [Oleispira antarctica RB-8]|tara:strand:+ start:170 stop:460 length:291 start_codon:yes stop_codon:yes gene_type:complete
MKIIMIILLILPFTAFAGDVIRLDGISIQGNSEEPSVLYVTPWQPAPGAGRLFAPVNSYRKQWLKPISRQIMKREVKYLNYFQNEYNFSSLDNKNK